MTVAEATVIADNALEHTVRTILAALQAPEILKSTSGKAACHFVQHTPVSHNAVQSVMPHQQSLMTPACDTVLVSAVGLNEGTGALQTVL